MLKCFNVGLRMLNILAVRIESSVFLTRVFAALADVGNALGWLAQKGLQVSRRNRRSPAHAFEPDPAE